MLSTLNNGRGEGERGICASASATSSSGASSQGAKALPGTLLMHLRSFGCQMVN